MKYLKIESEDIFITGVDYKSIYYEVFKKYGNKNDVRINKEYNEDYYIFLIVEMLNKNNYEYVLEDDSYLYLDKIKYYYKIKLRNRERILKDLVNSNELLVEDYTNRLYIKNKLIYQEISKKIEDEFLRLFDVV